MKILESKKGVEAAAEEGFKMSLGMIISIIILVGFLVWLGLHFWPSLMQLLGLS